MSGYTRRNCTIFVPVAVVGIMHKFYSQWNHRRFTAQEVRAIKNLSRRESISFPLDCFEFNDSEFNFYLKVESDWSQITTTVHLQFSSDIDSVSGVMDGYFSGPHCKETVREWRISGKWRQFHDGKCPDIPSKLIESIHIDYPPFADLEDGQTVALYFYSDIAQIVYASDSGKPHFDVAPRFKMKQKCICQWSADNQFLSSVRQLLSGNGNFNISNIGVSSDGQWQYQLLQREFGSFDRRHIDLAVMLNQNRPFPVCVSRFDVKVTVKGHIEGAGQQSKAFQVEHEIGFLCGKRRTISLNKILNENEALFMKISRFVIELEMEIVGVFGHKGQELVREHHL